MQDIVTGTPPPHLIGGAIRCGGEAGSRSADGGRPTGARGKNGRPGSRPGVRAVRRDDAADGLVLHVLELRQQHRLRLIRRR